MPRQHPASPLDSSSIRTSSNERLSLPILQSKMKLDPEGYTSELRQLQRHFESALSLFRHQSATSAPGSGGGGGDAAGAKELGDLALFLSHVAPFYPDELEELPDHIGDLLATNARALPPQLRLHLVNAMILLNNRKIVDLEDTLELFMDLQVIGDRPVRKLAFSHVVHSIRRMNQKHKNEAQNRKLQNVLFNLLQGEEELRAKRSLIILCDLHRRRVWFDDRTANAICNSCFHPSSRIMIAAISFLLGYERIEQEDDSEASSSEDEASQDPHVVLSKQDVYKAHHKGTTATKKKKKAKLQRVVRSMKRQQRRSTEENSSNYYSPLTYLKDPQGFAEKLFSRLRKCNERFEVKVMILKVVARTVGLHRLILLNLYPFLESYVQPHQRDVTTLLASAVQACHDMVPPDAVEPLFKKIVNQFVHDRSRPEAIAVGLNVVREICLRIPLLMNEDLLRDLVLYKKSHEKAVSTAARSLMTLFREICPSLLVKKDRGRPVDPKARPKAYGEVTVASDVPGAELLQEEENLSDDESNSSDSDDETSLLSTPGTHQSSENLSGANGETNVEEEDQISGEDDDVENDEVSGNGSDGSDDELEDDSEIDGATDISEDGNDVGDKEIGENLSDSENEDQDHDDEDEDSMSGSTKNENSKGEKRKFTDYMGQINAADSSLRALKRLAVVKNAQISSDETEIIYSNEDFQRMKELKARKEAKLALARHGLIKGSDSKSATIKIPSSEQLSVKRVDSSTLEANIRKKLNKEERLELVRAGREEVGKYRARAAVKQKKTGGSSNRQKEHKKRMPLVAKRAQVARSRRDKKNRQKHAGKQFRGRKAWK